MPAAFIIHSSPADPAGAQEYIDFLNGLHRAELHREIPGLESYTVYRDLSPDGVHVGITVVGVVPELTAAELSVQLMDGLARLSPAPGPAADPGDAPDIHFADLTA